MVSWSNLKFVVLDGLGFDVWFGFWCLNGFGFWCLVCCFELGFWGFGFGFELLILPSLRGWYNIEIFGVFTFGGVLCTLS